MENPLLLKILDKLDIMSSDIKKLDQRLSKVESWESEISKISKIETWGSKIDALESKILKMETWGPKIDALENKILKMEAWGPKIDALENKMLKMEAWGPKIDQLYSLVSYIEVDHGKKLDALLDYVKINDETHDEFKQIFEHHNYKLLNHDVRIDALEAKKV